MRTRPILSSSDPVPSITEGPVSPSASPGRHQSVLLHEAIGLLDIQKNDVALDATLGGAGHAEKITEKLGKKGLFVGFDLDHDAIARASAKLSNAVCRTELIEANFRTIDIALPERGIEKIDKALFDLGWSSFQLDAGRGFSFLKDEPLTMTYAKNPSPHAITASLIVNTWGEESIADIIFGWGEERYSRRIAKAIIERRKKKTFETSKELAETIKDSVPGFYRRGRIHPATRTFQALRIAVNDELGALTQGLNAAWRLLAPGGKIAVISFHSIEDRLVKQNFAEKEKAGEGTRLTKKPIPPSAEEIQHNPRARSAKLRVIQKN